MKHARGLSEKILSLNECIDQQERPDECLRQVISQASELMEVQKCSVMLARAGATEDGTPLRVFASHGLPPPLVREETSPSDKGVADHVAATGKPLLVNDILSSPYRGMARRPDDPGRGFISVPVMIGGKVVGVMNLSDATDHRDFNPMDLDMATFVALLVGKSLHVIQLQNLLKSRFAQIAISRETKNIARKAISADDVDPGRIALILARSFYREMVRNGFSSDHIITAASEIISQLTAELRSHKENMAKNS